MEFYPSVNNFTLALLLMLVTNITSVLLRGAISGLDWMNGYPGDVKCKAPFGANNNAI